MDPFNKMGLSQVHNQLIMLILLKNFTVLYRQGSLIHISWLLHCYKGPIWKGRSQGRASCQVYGLLEGGLWVLRSPIAFFGMFCNRIVAERCFKGIKQLKIQNAKGILQGSMYKYQALTALRPGVLLEYFFLKIYYLDCLIGFQETNQLLWTPWKEEMCMLVILLEWAWVFLPKEISS